MSGLTPTAASRVLRDSHRKAQLDLVRLTPLMEVTNGPSEVAIGLIDGPVAANHPDLAGQAVTDIRSRAVAFCNRMTSVACAHGSYLAGILVARRGSEAPAVCPDCVLLVRPIFPEPITNVDDLRAGPEELALALIDCADAGPAS